MARTSKIAGGDTIKVLLADECPVVLQGLRELLASAVNGTEVVGEATSREETVGLAAGLRPSFVFLDPSFHVRAPVPLREGDVPEIDVCRELKALIWTMRIVVYSAFNTTADLMALMLAGVDGYIHKSTTLHRLARNLKCALDGEPSWDLGLEREEAQRRLLAAAKVDRLTRAEKEILGLVLKGYGDRQMARSLRVSPHTVKKHVGSMLRKLEYGSRKALIRD